MYNESFKRFLTCSTDSSMDCSLENDEVNFLIQQAPAQHQGQQSKPTSNNLDKPFGMDLSVEFGGHSNRSSVVSQVRKITENFHIALT